MKTIKTKLFLIFTIFMILVVVCGVLLNSTFLESYYIYKNKGIFVSVSEKISNEYINNKENSDEYINMVDSIDNISTTIADRDMLEKAINNFMTNAIDYVKGRKFIQLIAENKENKIKISVFNTGSHIPMEDLNKIWDIYYK